MVNRRRRLRLLARRHCVKLQAFAPLIESTIHRIESTVATQLLLIPRMRYGLAPSRHSHYATNEKDIGGAGRR